MINDKAYKFSVRDTTEPLTRSEGDSSVFECATVSIKSYSDASDVAANIYFPAFFGNNLYFGIYNGERYPISDSRQENIVRDAAGSTVPLEHSNPYFQYEKIEVPLAVPSVEDGCVSAIAYFSSSSESTNYRLKITGCALEGYDPNDSEATVPTSEEIVARKMDSSPDPIYISFNSFDEARFLILGDCEIELVLQN